MAIGTNDNIDKFGTQDQVDDGTTVLIANNTFSVAADISTWPNTDDAPSIHGVLESQWTTTAPTDDVGTIDLYGRPMNIEGTNDPGTPGLLNKNVYLGHFPIDWSIAADTLWFSYLVPTRIPNSVSQQDWEFYLHNNETGQIITANWNLWIRPLTEGPSV